MKLTLLMLLCNTALFTSTSHPLSMGLMLISQTMLTAMLINMLLKTSWFSFIVVIVLLGGMLVLFIYMASIASNEKFKMTAKLFPMIIMIMMIIGMTMIIAPELETSLSLDVTDNQNILMLNKMFNSKNSLITVMMMIYLMYTMIAINNIVKINEGPLRKKN